MEASPDNPTSSIPGWVQHPPTARASSALQGLTGAQRLAVETLQGPLLVVAGPGSGKTRVITRRIAHLLESGVKPWQVLALTFTNRAAGEMRERVLKLLDPEAHDPRESRALRGLTITTFHSLCARLLRKYAEDAARVVPGLKPDFSIYDAGDQSSLMKRVIGEAGLNTKNFPPGSVLATVSSAKNLLLSPDDFDKQATDFFGKTAAKLYRAYERALRAANAVDFDDLLSLTVKALRASPAALEEIRGRWRYVMIDEYQDTNHAQFALAALIAGPATPDGGPNICVVGDPDQSIYAWRGADIRNILEFEAHYPGAQVVTLGENFRSTEPILKAADHLIRRNTQRKAKDLIPARDDAGDRPTVIITRDEHHEAETALGWIRDASEAGIPWREMAVMYRMNSLSRVMEDALRDAHIPYVIARGTAFYDREEIKDALAYLRLIANTSDDISLERIVNKPARGIGAATLERVRTEAVRHNIPLFDAMRAAETIEDLSPRARAAVRKFVDLVDGWTGGGTFMGATQSDGIAALVRTVVEDSGLRPTLEKRKNEDAADEDRVNNLDELVSSAADFEESYDPSSDPVTGMTGQADAEVPTLLGLLRAFLERVSLVADADTVDPERGAVTLMTLHAAKGLEFQAVTMIGLEEGVLPHARSLGHPDALEEERRLCFVGMTRAKDRLLITAAKSRTLRGLRERTIASQFLRELDGHVTYSDQADVWADEDAPSDDVIATAYRSTTSNSSPFPVGSMVRHPQFGIGKVRAATGGADGKVRVLFQAVGEKTLVTRYARLEPA